LTKRSVLKLKLEERIIKVKKIIDDISPISQKKKQKNLVISKKKN